MAEFFSKHLEILSKNLSTHRAVQHKRDHCRPQEGAHAEELGGDRLQVAGCGPVRVTQKVP